MQKTKLGLTVGLLAAATYFMGLLNFLGLILLVAYILLFESNEWLRKNAVKAAAVVIAFNLLSVVIGAGNNVLDFINELLSIVKINANLHYPLGVDSLLNTLINLGLKVSLLILGFKAYVLGSFPIKAIDNIVEKNM